MPAVLVDTDTGVDDALALLVLLVRDDVELVGIGSSYGNCSVEEAAANARYVLELMGREEVPLAMGEPAPPGHAYPRHVHGSDGMGGVGLRPRSLELGPDSAADQILRVAAERPGEVDLLTLGGLANVAKALEAAPDVLTRFRSVTIMGGMGPSRLEHSGVPGHPAYLEIGDPNINSAPAAAERVCRAPGPVSWLGMDAGGVVYEPYAIFEDPTADTRLGRFLREITAFYADFVTTSLRPPQHSFTVWDSIAASLILDPSVAVSAEDLPMVVRYDEQGRAAVWGDPEATGQAVHRIVTAVDAAAVSRNIQAVLTYRDTP